MKVIIFIFLLFSLKINSQENELKTLESKKLELTNKVQIFTDSINEINKQINFLKSKEIKDKVSDSSLISTAYEKGYIKETPDALGKIITQLDTDKQVIIIDYVDEYFGICTDTVCGYLNESWIYKTDEVFEFMKLKKKEQKILERLERENKLKKEQEEYAKLEKQYIKKYGQSTYNKLKEGYYWIGMNKEMAIISLGSPRDINKTVGSWGVHEQWVYSGGLYLYFENGKLTSYQN